MSQTSALFSTGLSRGGAWYSDDMDQLARAANQELVRQRMEFEIERERRIQEAEAAQEARFLDQRDADGQLAQFALAQLSAPGQPNSPLQGPPGPAGAMNDPRVGQLLQRASPQAQRAFINDTQQTLDDRIRMEAASQRQVQDAALARAIAEAGGLGSPAGRQIYNNALAMRNVGIDYQNTPRGDWNQLVQSPAPPATSGAEVARMVRMQAQILKTQIDSINRQRDKIMGGFMNGAVIAGPDGQPIKLSAQDAEQLLAQLNQRLQQVYEDGYSQMDPQGSQPAPMMGEFERRANMPPPTSAPSAPPATVAPPQTAAPAPSPADINKQQLDEARKLLEQNRARRN